MGTLYVVGTPIGNLEDITLRALRVLREVQLIAAEDTRTTRKLLQANEITTPLTSFHDFTGPGKVQRLVERLQEIDIALVSEAGMPGISDPGYPLIRQAIDAGVRVVPIPGPSAVLAALVASGLPMHAFCFLGFLPRKPGPRRRLLERVAGEAATLVLFEAPHRLLASLGALQEVLGDRPAVAARELTKVHEEFVRGPLSELHAHFTAHPPRGEFTLVVAGADSAGVLE
ncbi:MAG: 16S rRNA (cytidine(1402)-2'-O)-methyltransferase [Chloroflexi bacterium]|nr:16S rRNA (cytidine(1402)-2'-O)-methyltransferase [Chloroflexota bacterium]